MRPPTTSMVFVFDFNRRSLLLVQKQRPKWLSGKWNPPGGGIMRGETPLVAAIREVREETRIALTGAPRLCAIVDRPGSGSCAVYAIVQPDESLAAAARPPYPTDEPVAVWTIDDVRASAAYLSFPDDLLWLMEMALPAAAMDFRTPLPVLEVRVV